MGELIRRRVTVSATGGAGTSSGSGEIDLDTTIQVLCVKLDYTGCPASTDVTITDEVGATVLSVPNNATDTARYPVVPAAKAADGSASTLTEVPPVADDLFIAVAEANNGGTVGVEVIGAKLVP